MALMPCESTIRLGNVVVGELPMLKHDDEVAPPVVPAHARSSLGPSDFVQQQLHGLHRGAGESPMSDMVH